jgi:hypothetical protein
MIETNTDMIITPTDMTADGRYIRPGTGLFLPINMDDATPEPAPRTTEESVVASIAGEGKVIDTKSGIAVVCDPSLIQRVVDAAKEAIAGLTPGKVAYAAGLGLVAGYAAFGAPADAYATSAEVFARGDDMLLEVKAGTGAVNLGVGDAKYFARVRATIDYDLEKKGMFMLNQLSLDPDIAGIVPFGQLRIIGDNIVPVAAIGRMNNIGDMKLQTNVKAIFGDKTLVEGQAIMPGYDLGPLTLDAETIHAVGDDVSKGVFRGHLGYDIMDNLRVGVAGEAYFDYHNKGFSPVDTQVGAFVRIVK